MKRGRSKFMNKRDGYIDDKKIEEYLSSIPEQLKESDDFMLAQKGLEHLQENRSFESGDVLIKVKRRSIVCVGIVGVIILLIAAIIIGITVGEKSSQTFYDETLVLLSHKEPDSHISVNIEFGEGEGQISLKEVEKRAEARKPKEKVTYKMIQQYIEENYGFKVHTAYIAEVKRSLGLPMYDAPNVVEELKHPRPHPTERMVAAIKETLAHFDFI